MRLIIEFIEIFSKIETNSSILSLSIKQLYNFSSIIFFVKKIEDGMMYSLIRSLNYLNHIIYT